MGGCASFISNCKHFFLGRCKSWHYANIIHNLISEVDVAWMVEFEKGVKRKNRQALFDPLETLPVVNESRNVHSFSP